MDDYIDQESNDEHIIENKETDHDQIIENLLEEYNEHRKFIKDMIVDLEHIREKIETILPETLDKRFRFYFEEKIKSITSLFSTLLDMRKEIAKSVKDEVDIRRKISKDSKGFLGDDNIEGILDIRKIADNIEKLQFKKDNVVKQISDQIEGEEE